MPVVMPTAALTGADLVGVRALLDASFTSFTDHDWVHALGGLHALARGPGADGGRVLAHGSLVLRRLTVGGRVLRCGYVEAVAVAADQRREGLGGRVMAALETQAPGCDLLALCASRSAVPFYLARGWRAWLGPTGVLTPDGVRRTPEEDGTVHVLGPPADLDLDALLTCDWRDGDVW